MAEPILEQIPEAIVASLAAIVGDSGVTYWYTPDRVPRFLAFTDACLDDSLKTIYILSPDRVERKNYASLEVERDVFFDITAAAQLGQGDELPFAKNGSNHARATKQNHMMADIEKKLTGGDLTLGISGVWLTTILNWDVDAEQTALEGWALAFGRIKVSYRLRRDLS